MRFSKNELRRESNRLCLGWFKVALFCAIGLLWFALPCVAQDAVESGRQALEKSRFAWYPGENTNGDSFGIPPEVRASSSNRSSIPPRAPAAASSNFNSPFLSWLGNMLSNIFSGGFWGLSIIGWICVVVAVVFLTVLLMWFGRRFDLLGGETIISDDEFEDEEERSERIKELPFQLVHTSGDLQVQARAAFDAGDFRLAMTLLYSHVLLALDRRHFIRLRRGKTNRQYLRELRQHDNLKGYFQRVMVPFEETFFGDHHLEKHVFENCWGELNGFQELINQSSQVGSE